MKVVIAFEFDLQGDLIPYFVMVCVVNVINQLTASPDIKNISINTNVNG